MKRFLILSFFLATVNSSLSIASEETINSAPKIRAVLGSFLKYFFVPPPCCDEPGCLPACHSDLNQSEGQYICCPLTMNACVSEDVSCLCFPCAMALDAGSWVCCFARTRYAQKMALNRLEHPRRKLESFHKEGGLPETFVVTNWGERRPIGVLVVRPKIEEVPVQIVLK